jgi:hypothetical protein
MLSCRHWHRFESGAFGIWSRGVICEDIKNPAATLICESVSKSFRTGRLERELQMVQLSTTRCSYIAILWVSLVSFAAITLCIASQPVFVVISVYFVMNQSGNFWILPVHNKNRKTQLYNNMFVERQYFKLYKIKFVELGEYKVNAANRCDRWIITGNDKKIFY